MGRREVHEEFKGASQKAGRETGENILGEARGGDGFRNWSRVPSAEQD